MGRFSYHDRLYTLGYATYEDYLRSAHWQRVRVRSWPALGKTCFICGAPATELHHRDYAALGRENPTDLTPVCRACHQDVHALAKDGVPLKVAHIQARVQSDFRAGLDGPLEQTTPKMSKMSKNARKRARRHARKANRGRAAS